MKNYGEGYTTDITYDHYYCKDIGPNYLEFLLLLKGCALPARAKDEPLRYLELGFGQGVSMSVHTVSNKGEFWGTDFNPNQVLQAQNALKGTDAKANILNDSFAELLRKSDNGNLPMFDVITFHGIWSWISSENQKYILKIISQNLKVGGVVYVSYNCMPGWSSFFPIRDLMLMHFENGSKGLNSIQKAQNAFEETKKLKEAGAFFFRDHQGVAGKFDNLEKHSASYIVHEYLNKDWYVPYFKDVANAMDSSKCSFLTSTRLLNQMPIALPENALPLLNSVTDVNMKETMRDFALNTQFRCDLFTKGKRNLTKEETEEKFNNQLIALSAQFSLIKYSFKCPRGTVTCKEELYKPFVEELKKNSYKPKTIGEIKKLAVYKDMSAADFLEIITILLSNGYIHPAKEVSKQEQENCNILNRNYCINSLTQTSSQYLASPVIGSGIFVSRVEQMFLYAKSIGFTAPAKYGKYVAEHIEKRGEKLKKDGEAIEGEKLVSYLENEGKAFEKEKLPFLASLGIRI